MLLDNACTQNVGSERYKLDTRNQRSDEEVIESSSAGVPDATLLYAAAVDT